MSVFPGLRFGFSLECALSVRLRVIDDARTTINRLSRMATIHPLVDEAVSNAKNPRIAAAPKIDAPAIKSGRPNTYREQMSAPIAESNNAIT